jgi:hypothetical protein
MPFMMKKPKTLLFMLIALVSCEMEPEDLLIGTWQGLQSDVTIAFQEGGLYSWQIDYMSDPNSGTGFYEIAEDTLKIELNIFWSDSTLITLYYFSVSKKELELINIETQEIRNYERIKRHWLL